MSSIKILHPEGKDRHFSGILHLYLRSSAAKHCEKRHIPEPPHPRPIYT